MSAYAAFVIIQPNGVVTKGIPFVSDDDDVPRCPLCGADLTDEYQPGFGFAFGGFGTYWYCTSDDCPWFYKIQAPVE